MDDLIKEYESVITSYVCEDIIEKYENESNNNNCFNIPKNDVEWKKIESLLYKSLLLKINDYKNTIINNLNNKDIFNINLNNLYLDNFTIHKYSSNSKEKFIKNYNRTNNRYNILTFVFYLNDIIDGGYIEFINKKIKIYPKQGKLLIFLDDLNYDYKCYIPFSNTDNVINQYIITGQLCKQLFN